MNKPIERFSMPNVPTDSLFVVNLQIMYICQNEVLAIIRGKDEAHSPNTCDFPGGKLEHFEIGDNALEKAALRELYEETGVTEGRLPVYVCSSTFVADDGTCVANLVYKLNVSDKIKPRAGADEASAFWVSIPEFLSDIRTQPWTKSYMQRALDQ